MSATKDEAKKLIDELPEGVTWDDIIEEMYVKQKIENAIAAAERGEVIPHEEVKRRFLGS